MREPRRRTGAGKDRSCAFSLLVLVAAATSACGSDGDGNPEGVAESDLAAKSVVVEGAIALGETKTVHYAGGAKYPAFSLQAAAGDKLDVWVRSTNGDAYAYVLDSTFATKLSNGNADATTKDAHLKTTIKTAGTYYVALRDYGYKAADFTVSFAGAPPPPPVDPDAPAVFGDADLYVVGPLAYGGTTEPIHYTDGVAAYWGPSFRGVAGDTVHIDARGSIFHLLDASKKVLASSDGKSLLNAVLPATGTYYVALRDPYYENGTFGVALNAKVALDGFDPAKPTGAYGTGSRGPPASGRAPRPSTSRS